MNKSEDKSEREKADAARELLLSGEETVSAEAVQELLEAKANLGEKLQIEHLIEANQQLVLAMLSALPDTASSPEGQVPDRCRDIREANEQLVLAALSAQDLQAKAEQALAQQKSAMAMVAHELRNPLTPISMMAERMVGMPTDQLPRMQALIEGQVQHMSRLVEDLLDVSRAGTGKLRLNRLDLDIVQVINNAIDACRPLMKAKRQLFNARFPDQSLTVNGDAVRLSQVLHNLLTNAAKYTPVDGSIELTVTLDGAVMKISICDNGIGISEKALPFVFDPYVQDVNAVGFNGSGLGIGLTVVRELVEAHGGTVTGTSEGYDKGSEFIVTLPLVSHE